MKNHIVCKFIGVFLCALMLLSAVSSGLGILALASLGLDRDASFETAYEQDAAKTRTRAATELVGRYTTEHLGKCPQIMINDFYGDSVMNERFRDGTAYYTIRNSDGELLESSYNGEEGMTEYLLYVDTVRYYSIVRPDELSYAEPEPAVVSESAQANAALSSEIPEEVPAAAEQTEEQTMPAEEAEAAEAAEDIPETEASDAVPQTEETEPQPTEEPAAPAEQAETEPVRLDTVLAAEEPEAVSGSADAEMFMSRAADPDSVTVISAEAAEEIAAESETGATDPTVVPATEEPDSNAAVASSRTVAKKQPVAPKTIYTYDRFDGITYSYSRENSPGYYVSLYLAPNARAEDTVWSVLRILWNHRSQLVIILGASLMLFAICAVYLCCAAGRSPAGTEVRAGGLNRMPLDLYAAIAAGIITAIAYLAVEGMDYLLRQGLSIAAPILFYGGFVCCLVFVGFCFAFAAQLKTPDGFLLRNTVVGRVVRLTGRVLRWCGRTLARLFHWLPSAVAGIWHLVVRIWRAGIIFLTWGMLQVKTFAAGLWHVIGSIFGWIGKIFRRFFGLLPLVWQWLLVAVVLLLMLMFVFHAYRLDDPPVWMALAITIAVVVYASNSFGSLLEAAKKMRAGDLDSKVDNRLMVGGYREFADELNGLADVAVVAAQKQLKSERMKTELITNVSHDIKTPLTSIINYVDLLQKPHTPEEQATYLEVLSRQSQRLKKLIEDLMEMSKASTGNVQVDISVIDTGEAVKQALGEFADKLEAVRLTPVFHQPEEPVYVYADGRLLWRALSNVLGNAVKYALPGTRLYIDLKRVDGNAVLSLKNISREQLNISADELLERFVRGDSSRNTEGSGLGLNIAKSLLEVQHGQLELMVDGDLFKITMVLPCVD